MTCKHLKELYDVCQSHQLRITSTDLVRIVCPQCGVEEVCPSVLADEYDRHHTAESSDTGTPVNESVAAKPTDETTKPA
jgi:predicted RNA-binding Zn-ribbon protein involved in translation (DUF1610 family)